MGNLSQVRNCAILFGVWVAIVTVGLASGQNPSQLEYAFDPFSTDQWFKQKLDHFDSGNVENWPQRYLTSYRFYRLGGPIFLFLSGPGPELALRDIESGAIARYAEEQGAFVIGFEHRFYGKSRPTQDLETDNLQYLTIPQTLEDIAAFIRFWKARDDFRDSKWALFGASYLGSVTAWFAQKHPELIDAFVASSAPLELRYEIPEFLENVGFILNRTDPKCYDTVATGFKCLADIFNEQGCEGYTLNDVKTKFDFCSDLDPTRSLDATGAIAELFSTINGVVMYHDPAPDSFPDTNLDRFCRHMSSDYGGKTALEKIADKVREINKHRGAGCAEFRFETTVEFLDEKGWDSSAAKEGYRQLQWQLCNELGWTVAAANISQPFGNYLNPFLHAQICQKLFGLTETEMRLKVLKANTDLHGKNLTTQCGIFVNGDMDPWHSFSITTPVEAGKCNRAILIEGGSHGRDIEDFTNVPSHPPTVRESQIRIARYLDTWLKTGRCCDDDGSSRLARAPNPVDFYKVGELAKTPNVQIRHKAYPYDENERMIAAPTSIPYQFSTTDVLSVSPRIPVREAPASISSEQFDGDMYRDPRNAEIRRYRLVKMLRHRHPSIEPMTEVKDVPSMEDFEADFPRFNIRVEGHVEKVYKNGSRVAETTQIPTPVLDERLHEQVEMFNRGRKIMTQTGRPNLAVSPTPKGDMGKGGETQDDKDHFRYVVKHVFKDVVDRKEVDGKNEGGETVQSTNVQPDNPGKIPSKRQQSLEKGDVDKIKRARSDDDSSSSSSESSSGSGESSSEENDTSKSSEDEDDDSLSTSDSVEHPAIDPRTEKEKTPEASVERKPGKSTKSENNSRGRSLDEDDEDNSVDAEDSDYYSDEYDDDDDDDNDDGSNEVERKSTSNKKTSSSRTSNSSTEFTSGADSKPRRLREKISEKIMSSSEDVAGDQKSKEKANKNNGSSKGHQSKHESDEGSDEDDNLKDTKDDDSNKSSFSEEDYNYSLEPSGSDPQHTYRKSNRKQLEPLAKSAIEEPGTVINVEISGSYPKRKHGKSRSKSSRTTTTMEPKHEEDDENSSTSSSSEEITTTKKPKRVRKVRRKKKKNKSSTTTTTTTSTTTTAPTTFTPHQEENPRENSYVAWNRERLSRNEAKPVQQQAPEVVNLPVGSNTNGEYGAFPTEVTETVTATPNKQGNDNVIYIVIGDIPREQEGDEENVIVNDRPTGDDLFKFIQKLVNRHSPGMLPQSPPPPPQETGEGNPELESSPPSPPSPPLPLSPPSPQPTAPPESPPPPPMMNYGFDGPTGKYLLVRPVQVVALGREQVVHPHDLKNDTLMDLMTMETPTHPSPYAYQQYRWNSPYYHNPNVRRQYNDGYNFKSPGHKDQFERLLSVDDQVRDSDREDGGGYYRQSYRRRLDQIPDPSWRSIRGISQFGPAIPQQGMRNNPTSGLLSLSAADTQWVNQGVPFLPRNGRH